MSGFRQFLILSLAYLVAESKFIHFQPEFEYEYKFDSHSEVKDLDTFHIRAKISYTNVQEVPEGQELLLKVRTFLFSPKNDPGVRGHDWDFSKWFSFVITRSGEIVRVYHPHGEEEEVVAIKKGFAALLSSKLHQQHEVTGWTGKDGSWSYDAEELGHEGPHNATYTVTPTSEGTAFKKVRHGHPVKNAKARYEKTLYYHDDLGTIHRVMIEEDFTVLSTTAEGFDPYYSMRRVKSVNEFSSMAYPEMSTFSKGDLHFLTRRKIRKEELRPDKDILTASIHIDKVPKRKRTKVNMTEVWENIENNVTCIRRQPAQGSPKLSICFRDIVETLDSLPEEELQKVADFYFAQLKPVLTKNVVARETMLDAFGALHSPPAQELLVKYILLVRKPNSNLVQSLFVHIVALDDPPVQSVMTTLEKMCFSPEDFPDSMFEGDTYHRALLTMGAVANKLSKKGDAQNASIFVEKIHQILGLHDPWKYRQKRAVMSEADTLFYDNRKVVLLETLGNAGMPESFPYIVSHVNTTNSPWIKRAGAHALRRYHHKEAAEVLWRTAMYDEDENVRYESLLQYQAHPQAYVIAPLDNHLPGNTTAIIDPYSSGINEISNHHRSRRGFNINIAFKLESPAVDWRKVLGSSDMGASFGLIMKNLLDLKISLLSGHVKLEVHDEVYARVHIGFFGLNLDFFLARVCFKGGAEYNLNLLQEFGVDNIKNLAKKFDGIITKVVDTVKTGVDLFRSLINGDISIKDIVNNFVSALEELPGKVISLRGKAVAVMEKLGRFDESELPKFLVPLRNLVVKVSNLFNDIKTDIMTFYNTLVETVTIVIPQAAKNIYEDIKTIIDAFGDLLNDPKSSIMKIGKGVVGIFMSVKQLLEAKNKTMEACFFLKEDKPYWWDVGTQFNIVKGMAGNARKALATAGSDWVHMVETIKEDPVAFFTKGKQTLSQLRQEVIDDLTSIVDELLEPFDGLKNIAEPFIEQFKKLFGIVKDIKAAYSAIKEGYQKARSFIDKVFGPKAHKKFPRKIRAPGGGCDGEGFFPSSLKSTSKRPEYHDDGVDILASEGKKIVAPFEGTVYRSNKPNEVLIQAAGGSFRNTEFVITNINPNASIVSKTDPMYIEKRVSAGQIIGVATRSPCGTENHIHFSLRKGVDVYADPSRFLESRLLEMPKWIQECDDYKLVFKFETIAAGSIVGLLGRKKNDTTPKRNNTKIAKPGPVRADKDPGKDTEAMKKDIASVFSKAKTVPIPPDYGSPASTTTGGSNSSTADPQKKVGGLGSLINKASAFLKKFSIRRLKLGSIIDFLDKLDMEESKEKMAVVMKTVKKLIDNKPCWNPKQMTDDKLRVELTSRGFDSSGTREQMITRLTKSTNKCPLISFTMPKNIFCTFDSMCLGVECCINMKLFMFLKTFKVFARFDPCQFQFVMGVEKVWKKTIQVEMWDGDEGELGTGIQLDILGGVELIIRWRPMPTANRVQFPA